MTQRMTQHPKGFVSICFLLSSVLLSAACSVEQRTQSNPAASAAGVEGRSPSDALPIVDIAVAEASTTATTLSFSGTTAPVQTVGVRSRSEGQLLDITVDVGDRVSQGQFVAQLDTDLIQSEMNEAEAELAARQFEVEQARAELAEAKTAVERAKAELQQAQVDAERFQSLADDQVIPLQDAEVAQTNRQTAQQILRAAEEQVKNRERAVDSVQYRVAVQQAILDQAKERSGYAQLNAPLTGTVLTRSVDLGDVIQPGQMVLEIGDLSAVHVKIQVSDRELNQFSLGQTVDVQLDAFPEQSFGGTISQISPVADAAARLIPVEVTIPNPGGLISSGLMARVTAATTERQTVLIPETAIALADTESPVVFVPNLGGDEMTVTARPIEIGQRDNGRVEILSGLQPGDQFVVNSDTPLTDGQTVRRSFLSE